MVGELAGACWITLDAPSASLAVSHEDGGSNMEDKSCDGDARDRLASCHRGGPRTQDVQASVRSEQRNSLRSFHIVSSHRQHLLK